MRTTAKAFLPYAFRTNRGKVVHRVRRVEFYWEDGTLRGYVVTFRCSESMGDRSRPQFFRDLPDLPRCRTCFK